MITTRSNIKLVLRQETVESVFMVTPEDIQQ